MPLSLGDGEQVGRDELRGVEAAAEGDAAIDANLAAMVDWAPEIEDRPAGPDLGAAASSSSGAASSGDAAPVPVDAVVVQHGVAAAEFPFGDTIEGCKIRVGTRGDERWAYTRWQVTCPLSDNVHKGEDGKPCAKWRNTGSLQCSQFWKGRSLCVFRFVGASL